MAAYPDSKDRASDSVDRRTHLRTDWRSVDLGQQSGMSKLILFRSGCDQEFVRGKVSEDGEACDTG
jgi:hypothetical protein